MKFLCPACERMVEIATFRVEGGALVLHCQKCGAERKAENAALRDPEAPLSSEAPPAPLPLRAVAPRAPAGDPFTAPPGRCPKCIAPRPEEALSCAQCGLVFLNFVPGPAERSPALEARWRAVIDAWNDPDAHQDFLRASLSAGELAQAGRLYRIQLARAPEDPVARRGRDEVLRMATAASLEVAQVRTDARKVRFSREKLRTWGVAGVVLVAFLYSLRLLLFPPR